MNLDRQENNDPEITSNRQPRFSTAYIDLSTDPRTDLYRYASGKWLDSNPIPSDKAEWGSFYELFEWNRVVLRGIAAECASDTNAQKDPYKRLVGDFYKSAMDEKTINEIRFAPIEDLWGLISHAESIQYLVKLIPRLHKEGIPVFFDVGSSVDEKNSSIYALYLEQGGLSLPDRDYYIQESFAEMRKEFRAHMERMFILKGIPQDKAKEWAASVFELETSIANASRSAADLRDVEKNYNRIEIGTLAKRFTSMGLNDYLDEIGVRGVEYAVIRQPEVFDYLEKLFKETDVEKMRAYLYWHVLLGYAGSMHDEVFNEVFDFFGRKLTGQQGPEPRWKRALRSIDSHIGEALGKLYVERQFGEAAHAKSLELVHDLIDAFREKLEASDWMSNETRAMAVGKLDAMNIKIGYPDKFRDYSGLEVSPSDYVGNIRRSNEFELRRQATRVGKPVDRTEWNMTPPTVNAYYAPEMNEIVFPAGILQPPFFDAGIDATVNYGAIGTVIGHEITHGFDDQGRHYDSKGNMIDWWTEDDVKKFNEKAEAVVKLYGSQEVLPSTFINGKLTLGENIADLGGVGIAYAALQKLYSRRPEERKTIDGLTPDQRFFIAYAQIWKTNIREEALRMRLTVDPHSPEKYRVNIPSINQPAFDKAFPPATPQMKSGSVERTGVW